MSITKLKLHHLKLLQLDHIEIDPTAFPEISIVSSQTKRNNRKQEETTENQEETTENQEETTENQEETTPPT